MHYRIGFQCPDTGLYVVATYAFGRINIRITEYAIEDFSDITIEELLNTIETTKKYCKRFTNKRCHSVEEANEYIIKVSDGQTFGFDY